MRERHKSYLQLDDGVGERSFYERWFHISSRDCYNFPLTLPRLHPNNISQHIVVNRATTCACEGGVRWALSKDQGR